MTETDHWAPPSLLGEGTVLSGRYRLRRLLGRGGMAEVYLAQDDVLNRQVAVKVFRSGTTTSDSDAKRQQLEAELLAGLSHPGLVTVFDAGYDADGELAFLVMEMVEGPTLSGRLAAGPLHGGQVRQVGASLAEALAYVHERGVVHRDVKPSNVLFVDADDSSSVKLADFGIARLADSARLTDAGLIVGSAHYLSPEQARGEDVGPPSDIYALGLVLLECLTGAPVFPGAGIEPVVARLRRDPQVPDDVDPALGRLLTAMTSREPARRPTAHQVATALGRTPSIQPLPRLPDAAVNERGGPTEPLLAGAVRAGHGGRVHRWAWVASACAAILVALAGSAALLADTPSTGVTTTDLPSSIASPDATHASPTPTTAIPAEPAVQPAGAADDTAAEDNSNGKNKNDGKNKSKGKSNGNGN